MNVKNVEQEIVHTVPLSTIGTMDVQRVIIVKAAISAVKYESNDYDELLLQVWLYRIDKAIDLWLSDNWKENPMTPQEELFAKLFNAHVIEVAQMDTLTRRAHREELAEIAFKARVFLSATDHVEKEEKKKAKAEQGPTGFSRSVNTDDQTTAAINTVKERQKKMSLNEKIRQGLMKLHDNDAAKVDEIMSAGALIKQVKLKELAEQKAVADANAPKAINPFAKKE